MAEEHFFYVAPANIKHNHFILDERESHHAFQVLRLHVEDEIWLLDGVGTAFKGMIKSCGRKVEGIITQSFSNYGEPKIKQHLAVGMIKKERFEWLLEKAVECGATAITPLIMERCVKRTLNMDRSENIIQTAAKQCGRSRFPILNQPVQLTEFISKKSVMICLRYDGAESLAEWVKDHKPQEVTMIVGPEGDFSPAELELIQNNSIPFVNLGYRRLRTETAAITALNILEHGVHHE